MSTPLGCRHKEVLLSHMREPRVLLFGGKGRLGSAVDAALRATTPEVSVISPTRQECDLQSEDAVRATIRESMPHFLVNCAAFTDVDAAEEVPDVAWQVNCEAVSVMASEIASVPGAMLVQVSTDYVFGGDSGSPFEEGDAPHPVNAYGRSKAMAEEILRRVIPDRHLIVRTAWLYGGAPADYAASILRALRETGSVAVAGDMRSNPCYVPDVAERIVQLMMLLRNNPVAAGGTYHVVNEGSASRVEVGRFLSECAGVAARVDPISIGSLGLAAPRPVDSSLIDTRFSSIGLGRLRGWREAMAQFVSGQVPKET